MTQPESSIFTFPSAYIFQYSVPNHKEIKDNLLPKILQEYEENQQKKSYRWYLRSNSNLTTNFKHAMPTLLSPKQQTDIIWNGFDEMLAMFFAPDSTLRPCEAMPVKSNIDGYWWNVYNEGDYVEVHSHGTSGISGFYILDLPENQENNTSFICPTPYSPSREEWTTTHTASYLKEGDVAFFPSSLDHYVNPSKGRKVSISFNIEIIFDKLVDGSLGGLFQKN